MKHPHYNAGRSKAPLIAIITAIILLVTVLIIFLLLQNYEVPLTHSSCPPPGEATEAPPDLSNTLSMLPASMPSDAKEVINITGHHAVTMAGFNFSDPQSKKIFICDPGDESGPGSSHQFVHDPIELPLITDGRWWFIDYPGEAVGCIYAAIVVKNGIPNGETLPTEWKQSSIPDLSQTSIASWGDSLCGPAAAANIIWMLSGEHHTLSPLVAFDLPENMPVSQQANILIAGDKAPFPSQKSLASLMNSDLETGTDTSGLSQGLKLYLNNNTSKPWKYQDPTIIPSDLYLNSLAKESSNGSGIILLLLWGNPKMEDEDRGGPILWALDNITEEPATSLTDSNATTPTSPKSVSDPAPISNSIPAEIKTVVTKNITASDISKRLEDIKAGSGDIQITLAWNGYNDLDLSCTEPGGTLINFENRLSASGGNLDVDMNATPRSKYPFENLFWPTSKAPRGKYSVYANFYRQHTKSAEPVHYTLRVIINGKEKLTSGQLMPRSGTKEIFSFNY